MGEETKIQWTDHTFNPWVGCSKVHAGCTHCYAEADMDRRRHFAVWGPNGTRVITSESYWKNPLRWGRMAQQCGVRRRVFCASLADVFEDWGGNVVDHSGKTVGVHADGCLCPPDQRPARDATLNDVRRSLFASIDATPNLDWLLLTKRPENIRKMWSDYFPGGYVAEAGAMNQEGSRPNVWIGTSISDQATADKMVPELMKCRDLAPVLFLSIEPLLGPVSILKHLLCRDCESDFGTYDRTPEPCDGSCPKIDWVIVGGESGPNARPCDLEWIRSIVDQCRAADVPCFVKQIGSIAVDSSMKEPDGTPGILLGLKDKKGGNHDEWPLDLRVRQFPKVAV